MRSRWCPRDQRGWGAQIPLAATHAVSSPEIGAGGGGLAAKGCGHLATLENVNEGGSAELTNGYQSEPIVYQGPGQVLYPCCTVNPHNFGLTAFFR